MKSYDNYVTWKGWDAQPLDSPFASEAYLNELKRSGIEKKSKTLEIGFGNGLFLDWAKENGFSVIGLEIIEELVVRARERGHMVFHGHPFVLVDSYGNSFDLICMFDVLEHVPMDEIPDYFRTAAQLLRLGGKMLMRIPNGKSPFSRHIQYGDMTHVSVLSDSIIGQISAPYGFGAPRTRNAFRSARSGTQSGLKKKLGYILRDLVEIFTAKIYIGRRIPLDPVVVVTIEKEREV